MSGPPEAAGESGGEPLAPKVLAELRTVGGDELIRELMTVFAERTPERLRSARQAVAAGDLAGAAAAVHSLRSAAGTVGAQRLAALAGELERAARGGGGDLSPGLAELEAEAEKALREARRLGGAGAGGA